MAFCPYNYLQYKEKPLIHSLTFIVTWYRRRLSLPNFAVEDSLLVVDRIVIKHPTPSPQAYRS